MVEHRVSVKQSDGRVVSGYSPGFDPADGSIWVTPEPGSPQGVMIPLERVRVLVLERLDRRPYVPPGPEPTDPSMGIQLSFPDGEVLFGRQKSGDVWRGLWVQPEGRPFARAFVPSGAGAHVEPEIPPLESDASWAFVGTSSAPEPVGPKAPSGATELLAVVSSRAALSGAGTSPVVWPEHDASETPLEFELPAALRDDHGALTHGGPLSEEDSAEVTGSDTLRMPAVRPAPSDGGETMPDTPLDALFPRER